MIMVGSFNQGRDSVYKLVADAELQDLKVYNCVHTDDKLTIYSTSKESTVNEWIESSDSIDLNEDIVDQLETDEDNISPTD